MPSRPPPRRRRSPAAPARRRASPARPRRGPARPRRGPAAPDGGDIAGAPDGGDIAGRLTARLLERALLHVRAGAAALEGGRGDEAAASLREASRIVIDLHTSLEVAEDAAALAPALGPIYRRVGLRLRDGALLRDPSALREAALALAPLADAFGAAASELERRDGAAAAPPLPGPGGRRRRRLGGREG
jgi:flagellin-specific chaperone FliS